MRYQAEGQVQGGAENARRPVNIPSLWQRHRRSGQLLLTRSLPAVFHESLTLRVRLLRLQDYEMLLQAARSPVEDEDLDLEQKAGALAPPLRHLAAAAICPACGAPLRVSQQLLP